MNPYILAAALELSRIHGETYAALFLLERDIAFETIWELLHHPCVQRATCQEPLASD